MATASELLGDVSVVDKTLVISNDFRTINIPSSVPNLGVEYDDDVLRLDFKMPRYVSDTDLSKFAIRINYINSKGESDAYTVSDALVGKDDITFSWLVGPTATRYKGNTKFIVCAKIAKADGTVDKEFNTTIATLPVLEGLEVDEAIVTEYSDIIEQWRKELFGIGDTEEASIKAVSEAQQAAIENKGAEVLASIPVDYWAAVRMTDNAERSKADAIVCSTQGDAIKVSDSSDDYLRGLNIYGKTTQVNTTGTQLFNPYTTQNNSFGNAVIENNGARITVTGTYYVSWPITLKAGFTYYINFKTVGNAANRAIRFEYPDKEITENVTNPTSFTPTKDTVAVYLYSGLGTEGTITYEDVQISEGSTAIPWEPYSGGVASPSPVWPQNLINIAPQDTINLGIYGKNLLPNNAGNNTHNGITYTTSPEGIITANGTATEASMANMLTIYELPPQFRPGITYKIFGATDVAAMQVYEFVNGWVQRAGTKIGGEFTVTEKATGLLVRYVINPGTTVTNLKLYPMICLSSVTDDTYESYKEPQNTAMTSGDTLLGIPVESDGTYTDTNGRQWVCDEIDFERGLYIKRVGSKIYDGSTDEIWYKDSLVLDNTIMFRIQIDDSVNIGNVVGKDYLCSNFPVKNMYNSDVEGTQHTMQQFYFRLNKTTLTTADLAGFRAYLAENPMTVQYVLATPIETPLTAEEIEWFRFAHTNYPNTTILNDAAATMKLKYNADTKIWLDNVPKVTDEQAGPLVEAWMDEHFTDVEGVVYGKSAYEIALERGFVGSEAAWLASLKGQDGYTPTRGIDYYTDVEREELLETTINSVTPERIGAPTMDQFVNFANETIDHTINRNNPHGVTPEQIGAPTQENFSILAQNVTNHIEDLNNPHGITLKQIGAAPAGFGLGESALPVVSLGDLDNLVGTGWSYLHEDNTLINGVRLNYAYIYTIHNGPNRHQELRPVATSYVLIRDCYNGVWSEWECDNPPMQLGIEYRTTERSEAKPVYAKRISYTTTEPLGDANSAIDTVIAHGISNFNYLVRCSGRYNSYPLPLLNATGGSLSINQVSISAISLRAYKETISPCTIYFDLYYTKTS